MELYNIAGTSIIEEKKRDGAECTRRNSITYHTVNVVIPASHYIYSIQYSVDVAFINKVVHL